MRHLELEEAIPPSLVLGLEVRLPDRAHRLGAAGDLVAGLEVTEDDVAGEVELELVAAGELKDQQLVAQRPQITDRGVHRSAGVVEIGDDYDQLPRPACDQMSCEPGERRPGAGRVEALEAVEKLEEWTPSARHDVETVVLRNRVERQSIALPIR